MECLVIEIKKRRINKRMIRREIKRGRRRRRRSPKH